MGEIELKIGFSPLAFILYLCKSRISIDGGEPVVRRWGTERIPVQPGQHRVTVWFRYAFIQQACIGDVVVDVPPGAQVPVSYRVPWLIFLPGKMAVDPPQSGAPQVAASGSAPPPQGEAPAAQVVGGAPAAWLQDPTGRHELRWWDGTTWSANVSDRGATSTDPV